MEMFSLKEPIQWGEELVKEVSIRPLKAKHLKKMATSPTYADMLVVVGHMIDRPSAFVDELSAEDATSLIGKVGDFLGGGQETGAS